MRAIFRVDSSNEIGSGHISRCLTLAKSLRERGFDCLFLCRDHPGNFNSWLISAGFSVELLPVDPKLEQNCPERPYEKWIGSSVVADAEATISFIREKRNELVVVDHYGLDYAWEDKLRPHTNKIVAIDDLANRRHNANYLLDQNLVSNYQTRYSGLLSKDCVPLLGPEFALLQPEYSRLRPAATPRTGPVRRILIFFGGSDSANLTGLSVSAFLKLGRSDIELDVVLGNGSSRSTQIERCARVHPNVHIHHSLPTLAHLMLKADLAIGAAGSTAWERCCLGLPSIVITLADNQKEIAEELNRRGAVRWLGHHNTVTQDSLADSLRSVLNEASIEQWSRNCVGITDGAGTFKITSILSLNVRTPLFLHHASLRDESFLLDLANDSLVRENAFNLDRISSDTHKDWFYSRLRHPDQSRIYIAKTLTGLPVGQVRFERVESTTWEVHYSLASFARGLGLGMAMLGQAIQRITEVVSLKMIVARVKKDNSPSLRIFEKLGFESKDFPDHIALLKEVIAEDLRNAH
jgi:UDP-2,4-diacetamido-2,4,6-trideoxy-beta-L-altropyranose hydrolase